MIRTAFMFMIRARVRITYLMFQLVWEMAWTTQETRKCINILINIGITVGGRNRTQSENRMGIIGAPLALTFLMYTTSNPDFTPTI